jgi:tripartite-type tricarboxylate transporter receptor subunit TctC
MMVRDNILCVTEVEKNMTKLRVILFALVAVCCVGVIAKPAAAQVYSSQVYPSRPITVIVPVPPGGVADPIARILADHMSAQLGQPMVIENVTGAGGSIGLARAARAAPDGYTLSIGNWLSHVGASAVYPVSYDVLKDFAPVSLLTVSPVLVIAKSNFPANDLKEMIAWLKANPDQASAATVGVGSAAHVSGAYFQKVTGTRFHFVPYRGGGPAMQDLVGGQVDLQFAEGTTALPAVRSRQVKTYAVMAPTRWFATPDVPTVDELGVPGLYLTFWHGLWVPKGASDQIIAKLNAAVVDALADAAVRRRLTDIGQEIMPRAQQTPEALAAYHKGEAEKWWPIIRAANIRGE